MSEIYGRKLSVLLPYFVGAMFSFGTAAAKDIQTILITRFFTGLFASAPVTNTGGVMSDIWPATSRGTAIVGYALAVVGGPTLGPIVGGAIITTGTSWRWTEYSTAIYMTMMFVIAMMVLDETYPPALLQRKASKLRMTTGNWALHCKHDEWDPSFRELAIKFGARPFQMLLTPICFFVALVSGSLLRTVEHLPFPSDLAVKIVEITAFSSPFAVVQFKLAHNFTVRIFRLRHPLCKPSLLPDRLPGGTRLEPTRRLASVPCSTRRHLPRSSSQRLQSDHIQQKVSSKWKQARP